jgi:hypothetical protein
MVTNRSHFSLALTLCSLVMLALFQNCSQPGNSSSNTASSDNSNSIAPGQGGGSGSTAPPPTAPTGFAATVVAGAVNLAWSEAGGADVTGFIVLRASLNQGGPFVTETGPYIFSPIANIANVNT